MPWTFEFKAFSEPDSGGCRLVVILQGVTTQGAPELMAHSDHQVAGEAEVDPRVLPMAPADLNGCGGLADHESE